MTRKDYQLIAEWLRDYSYLANVTNENGESVEERHWYRGAVEALIIRLHLDNPRFSDMRFMSVVNRKN